MRINVGIVLAVAIVLACGAVAIGYSIGLSRGELRERQRFVLSAQPQIADAIKRETGRYRSAKYLAMKGRYPRAMEFVRGDNRQICVELALEPGSIGGSPIYCYNGETTQLSGYYPGDE